jgi:hypothetical protein
MPTVISTGAPVTPNPVIEDPPPTPAPPAITSPPLSVSMPSNFSGNITDETIYIQGIVIASSQIDANASITVASANSQTAVYRAELDYSASVYDAAKRCEAQKYSADRQLEAVNNQLTYFNPVEGQLRQEDIDMRQTVAQIQATAQTTSAQTGAQADIQTATIRSQTDIANMSTRTQADTGIATIDYNARVFTAQANKDATVYSADQDLSGREYSADQQLAGTQYEADQQLAATQYSQQQETGRLNTKLAFAQDKYNDVFPFVQASLDAQGIQTPGLDIVDWPYIPAGGVLTERQIQQQVNTALAKNDSRTQAQILQAQTELAGRGFSSNSPLLQALLTGYLGQNLRANNDAETQIRIQSAQANAEQTLKAAELTVNEYQAKQGTVLESEKNQITRQVGLVGALAQLISGTA